MKIYTVYIARQEHPKLKIWRASRTYNINMRLEGEFIEYENS